MLVVVSWGWGGLGAGDLFTQRRLANLQRFLGEVMPFPLQGKPFDAMVAVRWAGEILSDRGLEAAVATLAIAVAASVLAALGALLACVPSTRTIATPEPYLPSTRPPSQARRTCWLLVVAVTRLALIFLRAIPEYVWAFLLIAVLGPSAWPAVIALAVHNAGILGKLASETLENATPGPLAAWRGLGATRAQMTALALWPTVMPRFLLYFFYRWETCVREATVLGMLGVVSLGFWIQDSRARNHYDEMVFLVLIGAAIVLVGDMVSAVSRRVVRRSA
jgi:phosphonate transport system permease protein